MPVGLALFGEKPMFLQADSLNSFTQSVIMIKNLLFLIIIILAVVVGYMYFFGKGEDRERAESVVNETKELGKSVADFIKRQKDRYDDGEFDRLLHRISKTIDRVRSKGSDTTKEENEELQELEKELRQIDTDKLSEENKKKLKELLRELETEVEKTD
jgi:molecular chaperone DnaK (HSP70)